MRRLFPKWLLMGVAACSLFGFASPDTVRADFLPAFTGNTEMSPASPGPNGLPTGGNTAGVVSFAVFDNTAGGNFVTNLETSLGLAAGSLKSNAIPGQVVPAAPKYVYYYQVVNITTPADVIEQLRVSNPGGLFTSAGYLTTTAGTPVVFTDGSGNVTNGNTGLGTDPLGDDLSNLIPSNSGVTKGPGVGQLTSIAALATAKIPDSTNLPSTGGGFARIQFNLAADQIPAAAPATSTIVFLTSEFKPIYRRGEIQDGFTPGAAIPTAATPEPASFAMAGLGILGCSILYRRRRVKS